MGIVAEDVARIVEAADLVAVVTQYTQLKRVGRQWSGLCPFHAERSPSFSVNGELGVYYCFGCQAKGDVITFVREKEGLDFVGAVEWLAGRTGVSLRYTDADEGAERKRRGHLHDVVERAVEWYHQRLLTAEDAGAARRYLRQRGYGGEVARRFRLGWAPDGWDELARALRLSDQDLTDSGLGFVNRVGRRQDAFRARLLFPIFEVQGRAVGFGGRVLPGGEGPKYKNSAESAVYAKSRVLYGLNWAKAAIVDADAVVVCEGYTDVIGFSLAGVPNAVATCGTALTEDHVRTLRKFARRVVLAFDADAAGQNAAARFYEWEKAHDVDVAVAALPDGVDPGELAAQDPQRLQAAVAGARSFLGFRLARVLDRAELATAEGRARAAGAALTVVAEHPDPLVRDQYVMEIAGRCRLDPDRVRASLDRGGPAAVSPDRPVRRRVQAHRDTAELEALKLMVHRPDEVRRLLVADLFDDDRCAAAYQALVDSGDLRQALGPAGPEVAELLQRLAVEDTEAEPVDVVSLLWKAWLGREIAQCAAQGRSADLATFAELNARQSWYKHQLEAVTDPQRRSAAVEGLLAWLVEEPGRGVDD
jgi:DNA primase